MMLHCRCSNSEFTCFDYFGMIVYRVVRGMKEYGGEEEGGGKGREEDGGGEEEEDSGGTTISHLTMFRSH